MKSFRPVLLGAVLVAFHTPALEAQGYGQAAAVVGENEVLIAEPLNALGPGVVYVYRRGGDRTWREAAQLRASDAAAGDHFGHALAVQGNTLIVGATVPDSGRGAAYVFRKDRSGAWQQVAMLVASDGAAADGFGRAVALDGNVAMIASWAHRDGRGAVYVFRRDPASGAWSESAKLMGSDVEPNQWFGGAVALAGDVALIGAPRLGQNAGAVYAFRRGATGTWQQEAKLVGSGVGQNSRFGSAIALAGDETLVGAPGHGGFVGAVFQFRRDAGSGEWQEAATLVPFDGSRGTRFGTALAVLGDGVWVGAPGADGFQGRVYVLDRDAGSRSWLAARKLAGRDLERRDAFAEVLGGNDAVAVVSLTRDDYGAGTAMIFERDGPRGAWREVTKVWSEIKGMDPVVGGQVDCHEGSAALFDCSEVDLLSFLPVQAVGGGRGVRLNDVWGWTDPVGGREYALVGRVDGTAFIDVSNPYNPVYVGELPKTTGAPGSTWRDIKVYKDHAFIVADGAQEHGMQVFDLSRLRSARQLPVTFTEDAHYDGIHSAHNIVINEGTGFAYTVGNSAGGETCGGGLHMINIQEPKRPTFAGCFSDPTTGRRKTGYTHDAQCVVYQGPDAEHRDKEICFGANETALSVADVSDKDRPIALAIAEYPNVGYSHQGWLTEDHRYFFMDDELDEIAGSVPTTRTLVWDVTDLDDPVLVKEFFGTTRATDHNLYVRGTYVYQSNYVSGLRVLDITDAENPVEVAYFDTVPYGENAPGFGGSWSNYPFFASGVIVVTSGREGVFLLKHRESRPLP